MLKPRYDHLQSELLSQAVLTVHKPGNENTLGEDRPLSRVKLWSMLVCMKSKEHERKCIK